MDVAGTETLNFVIYRGGQPYGMPYNEGSGVYYLFKAPEVVSWFRKQNVKTRMIVEARLLRLADCQHWGLVNRFEGLTELKWKSGLRIYTTEVERVKVIVLLGGNKNGQDKDIKKAKAIYKAHIDALQL